MPENSAKKIKLSKAQRLAKWAPIWAVIKKNGMGKTRHIHPSQMTRHRRSWRRTKLKISPRKLRPNHYG